MRDRFAHTDSLMLARTPASNKRPTCHATRRLCACQFFLSIHAVVAHRTDQSTQVRKPLSTVQRQAFGGPGFAGGTFRPSLGPLPPSVPEDAQITFMSDNGDAPKSKQDAALAAYLERSKFLHGNSGRIAPTSVNGLKQGPSGWNPSF